VEIHLLESKTHGALRNLPKSRAALTAARTAANAIYVPPSLQADIDTQSGTLHAEEKDFKTAYSYFYEAFEQLSALDDARAVTVLKYMLLCKVGDIPPCAAPLHPSTSFIPAPFPRPTVPMQIEPLQLPCSNPHPPQIMSGEVGDVSGIIASKGGLKYAGPNVDAMRAVSKAYDDRSLGEFQAALQSFAPQLQEDTVVHAHLSALYDVLLEQNLKRLIEPYSRVEIAHIASLIKLPLGTVEAKVSQMILDKKFAGTLDQGVGTLEIFEDAGEDPVYPAALETIDNMARVVDNLYARSSKIAA
jgi:26S proteasome regulatory subunit N6